VREGTEVYMEKLEGTNSWADLLAAIGQGCNSAVMGDLTRVFVHELVNSYLRRPSSSSRYVSPLLVLNEGFRAMIALDALLFGSKC
jgi:hypothetical protein